MTKKNYAKWHRLCVAVLICFIQTNVLALTEINVETAGTLQSLLTSTDSELKVTGVINGTDIKYIRQLVTAGTVRKLDWSGVSIVSGGSAYFESYTTENNIVGTKMFHDCSNLQKMVLPTNVTAIKNNAFTSTSLTSIEIPNSVKSVGEDAFAYCNSLNTVIIGKNVNQLSKGSFYGSSVQNAYVKPITPPSPPSYLFSSTPKIYVYSEALADYKELGWSSYGTLYGTLENYYPQETEDDDLVNELCGNFFEDAACTQLKAEYGSMSDEELTAALAAAGMPEYMVGIAIKVKNNTWANYEQYFRIHNYKAYSDAKAWNDKLWARCASYMGNPTGIYTQSNGEPLYVFVDDEVPADATLYCAGLGVDQMFTTGKAGKKLKKGLNIINGDANKLYYILYTVDTKSLTKRVSEWPEMKIHIEGGKVDGYFDASCHTDADYQNLLNAAANSTFVCKGKHSVMNIRTSVLKQTYPTKIAKSVECLDSLSVWEKDLIGISEAVANGEKAGAPYYLTGGDAFYPGYFNNPTYVDNDSPGSVAHSTEFGIHISLDASKTFLNPYISGYDESGTGHELGHQLQSPIMLEGTTEGSNDLFSCYCRFFMGHKTSMGESLRDMMQKYAEGVPFYWRGPNYGIIRMYYSLYLYYHQGQKNTSFYPELFKALRADKIVPYGSNTNNSGLKFVRKACQVAQEDLTDFFTVYGFFEPTSNRYLECYGDHYITNRRTDINRTKREIAQYEKKNREIIFIEDRVDYVPPTDFIPRDGEHRIGEAPGQFGDLGQFTSYLPGGACEPSSYVYYRTDSLYSMVGSGGVGFLMLDADGNIKYAANAKDICIPTSIGNDFTIYSVDVDGTLHEVTRAGSGTERVNLTSAGTLQSSLQNDNVIKLIVSGPINSTDRSYMNQLIKSQHLQAIDLEQTNPTLTTLISAKAFQGLKKLISIKLPLAKITSIGADAFSNTGLRMIDIPDRVTSVGEDAFAYCNDLNIVIIGKNARTLSKGAFYGSNVKDVYVKALTPPSISSYLFSSNPTIHVFASALSKYQSSSWASYGTIVGDLTEDMIVGIQTVQEEEMANGQWSMVNEVYDLMGRKVTNLKPGNIYICNGRKLMMK